jgi:hypothetical protein
MSLSTFTLSLNAEDMEAIKRVTENVSYFVRDAIKDKLGKSDKTIQELSIEIEELVNKLTEKENILDIKIKLMLDHKEQLKLIEIQEIEDKLKQKELKHKELMDKCGNLEQFDIIKNFEYIGGWENMANLLPIVELIKQQGVRIGIVQLREYLTSRHH